MEEIIWALFYLKLEGTEHYLVVLVWENPPVDQIISNFDTQYEACLDTCRPQFWATDDVTVNSHAKVRQSRGAECFLFISETLTE